LSGDQERAAEIAREVLERIEREPQEPETPYWRAATEAEALLLLGRLDEARAALEAAVVAAPQAWEDHASTLRQFLLIHDELGGDRAWLDMLRPPRSLHFSGHVQPDVDAPRAGLDKDVVSALEWVGFGYGALAAGPDLAIAEALLERGAQLHVVLPGDPESFAARFVDPFGSDWRQRFDAALDAAESVQFVRPIQVPPDPSVIALADEIALGSALLNAERLMGDAMQLLADVGEPRADGASASGVGWRARKVGPPPETQPVEHVAPLPGTDSRSNILALLAVSVGSGTDEGFQDRLEDVQGVLELAAGATIAPHLSGDSILIGYERPSEAADAARAIHAGLRGRIPIRIAGHYGLISCARDPFLGAIRPTEKGADIVKAIAGAIPPDTICVSGDFAAVLATAALVPNEASWIGELQAFDGGSPIGLYALRPAAAGS
jgi:tetratricopeptide (TPR) repeat protein